MMRSEILLQTPFWFIIFCFLAGGVYAFLLYQPVATWSRQANYVLGALRAITVALIVFLLLSPLVRRTETIVEKAKIVLAIDNSESVSKYAQALQALRVAKDELHAEGFDVTMVSMSGTEEDSIRFKYNRSDISAFLDRIKTDFEGENLTDVILFSDGIVNGGMSPAYKEYPFKVNTFGVGDTIPPRDIAVKDVIHNKVAYMGNEFPLKVEVIANGMSGKSTGVVLKQGGKVLASENILIEGNTYYKTIEFKTRAVRKGIQHFTVEVGNISGDQNAESNKKDVFVEVIDGKQKILLVAAVPHPDVKAFRSLIEANDNYELEVRTLSIHDELPADTKGCDMVIWHQVPNVLGLGNAAVRKFVDAGVPSLHVLGNQSAIPLVNTNNKMLNINSADNQTDKVSAKFNTAFQLLNFDPESLKLLERLPPLMVPFGEYRMSPGSETVLYQKVGALATQKPLLLLTVGEVSKSAILVGEGIWQWRQEEFALTSKHEVVDNLFQKIIQLLAIKDDKRKFRVYPIRPEFDNGEKVIFNTEIYNNIYEEVYGQHIKLDITDEKEQRQSYDYTHLKESAGFELSGLPSGVYRYQAGSNFNGIEEKVSGQFIVGGQDQELANRTADFGLLRTLAQNSGGKFLTANTLPAFVKDLKTNRPPDRLDATENTVDLINLKWLFFLLLMLLGMEWGLRKFLGSY